MDSGNSKDVQYEKQIIKLSLSLSLMAVLLQQIQGFFGCCSLVNPCYYYDKSFFYSVL